MNPKKKRPSSAANVKKNAANKAPASTQKHPAAKKKKPMHKKAKSNSFAEKIILPFSLLAVSLILETCFILTEQSGALGALIHKFFFGLFGVSAHIIPLSLLLVAFFMRDLSEQKNLRFKLIILTITLVLFSASATLSAQGTSVFSLEAFWVSGKNAESGGAVGGILGFVLEKIFGSVAATVIAILATVILASLAFGKTKFGIWRMFVKNKMPETAVEEPQIKSKKASAVHMPEPEHPQKPAPAAPMVSAQTVNTVLSAEEPAEREYSSEEQSFSATPQIIFSSDPESFEFNDGVSSDGTLTDTEEDGFDPAIDEEGLRAKYKPADLMDDFGFKDEEESPKVKPSGIYDEESVAPTVQTTIPSPASAPKPVQKSEPEQYESNAYSPFATTLTKEQFFEQKKNGGKAPSSTHTPKKSSEPSSSFSPFSDPLQSMKAPKRDNSDLPPQAIIAMGMTKEWEAMHAEAMALKEEQDAAEANAQDAKTDPSAQTFIANAMAAQTPSAAPTSPRLINDPVEEAPVTVYTEPTPIYSSGEAAFPHQNVSAAFPTAKEDTATQQHEPINNTEPAPAPSVAPSPAPQRAAKAQTSAPATPTAPKPLTIPPLMNGSAFDDEVERPEQEDPSAKVAFDDLEEQSSHAINPFSRYTKLRYPKYVKPSTDLLDLADESKKLPESEILDTMQKILSKFESFHVDASVTGYSAGPAITRYEITPGPGVKVKQITALSEDIGLAVQSEKINSGVRIANVPGKAVIGIEVPNSVVSKVALRTLIENPDFQKAKSKITVCVGLTVSGKPIYMNIDDMPHVLVAGQTKSGKSVAINAMIMSIIYRASPDEVQFILVDPKQVELSIYNDIPHMIMPVIDDVNRAAGALQWAVAEMERRYTLIKKARVRDRDEYYRTKDQNPDFEYMPQIVIIIDELADLMLQAREHVEEPINRLAAKARACGMNLVIGTQRPSTDIVTGLIKANIPSKIAFRVASSVDSRVILGNVGAEKLLGRGDMLYHPTGSNQIRAQGAFVDTAEIKRVLDFIIEKNGPVEYDLEILARLQAETDKLTKNDKKSMGGGDDDYAVDTADIDFDFLCQATELVINLGKATVNVVQRRLKIGFNRASNIVDKLEELHFISPANGSKPRDVLITMPEFLEWKNQNQR